MAEEIRMQLHPLARRWSRRRAKAEIEHLRKETNREIDDLRERVRALERVSDAR